jgi:hypothetical protein
MMSASFRAWSGDLQTSQVALHGVKLLNLLHAYEFEISALQCPTHYLPAANGDILNTVYKNVQLSQLTV